MNMDRLGDIVSVSFSIGFGILFTVIFVMSIVWAWRDAKARGQTGCLIALLMLMCWPWGFLVWLMFRPPFRQKTLGN